MLLGASTDFVDVASKGGVIGLLVTIIYGGFRSTPWWVFGWVYREQTDRLRELHATKERWKELALRGTEVAEAVGKVEK